MAVGLVVAPGGAGVLGLVVAHLLHVVGVVGVGGWEVGHLLVRNSDAQDLGQHVGLQPHHQWGGAKHVVCPLVVEQHPVNL